MSPERSSPHDREALRQVAGYLNFSSGSSDPATLARLSDLHAAASAGQPLAGPPPWLVMRQWLSDEIDSLEGTTPAFADMSQAREVLRLVWSELLPAYLDFHGDLLFHQEPEALFNGFLIGRGVEAVLNQGGPWDQTERIVAGAIRQLNDYVGFRPTAQLENRSCEPYEHEWVRPVPLYIEGAGVAAGPYGEIVTRALRALGETDPEILQAAHFDLRLLSELAFDPRAYDFDHPVNRRPNYHFGQWDPHHIDHSGRYRRFVVQQVTLDALLSRLKDDRDLPHEELLEEAAAVLAGTILMASGISGWGPAAHASNVTLTSLMAPIAAYRDAFYEGQLQRIAGPHAERLRAEAQQRQQPFGAARQHLNAALAERRAAQLQHVQLARLYARMGYPQSAKRQSDTVRVASARMMCRIDCLLTLGVRSLRSGSLEEAVRVPDQVMDLLRRGIQCGALVDPWNILGFAGNFSRFHGPESAVHDHRVDDLVTLMEQLFVYMARVWSEAAARDDLPHYELLESQFEANARWWRQYAAHTVESLQAVDPMDSFESAQLVARALRLWHRGGAAAGDVRFWAPHAELFDSPRAYALVIDALLRRDDFVASMALLVHWLSNAGRVGLRRGGSSLPRLAQRWLARLRTACQGAEGRPESVERPWSLVRKFFDYLEANAEEFWSAPVFLLGAKPQQRDWDRELEALDEEEPSGEGAGDEAEGGLFDAAYEGMTYTDSTADGFEGSVFEHDEGGQDELEAESRRLTDHLGFLSSLAHLWSVAADLGEVARAEAERSGDDQLAPARAAALADWARQAAHCRAGLLQLLDAVRSYRIPTGGADGDSMTAYDRRRLVRDSLLERIIATAVDLSDARRVLTGVLSAEPAGAEAAAEMVATMSEDDQRAVRLYGAIVAGDSAAIEAQFPPLLVAVREKNLLYIPLSRGGDPVKIFTARLRQRVLTHLLQWLPRRGHFADACQLIETARLMEQNHPVGPGAVTEFDGMFRIGFRSLVQALADAVQGWPEESRSPNELILLLEKLTETLLGSWLAHSRTLRLSALEAVSDRESWEGLVAFVRHYGDPVFTQSFLKLGNVRAILHQGVGPWLERLTESPEELAGAPLLRDLDGPLPRAAAEQYLAVVFEAILDHHTEYRDYNSTTTQSDRGDLFYMFLDFLRLRVRYDRIAWNLRPVMWAHEILVRSGFDSAAMMWRRSLSERIGAEAELYVEKLRQLQQQYAMRMPTVADRILERFVQPMTIDRMRALVAPAVSDAERGEPSHAFDILEQEADLLTRHPTGAGLDLPAWLAALEEEVDAVILTREAGDLDRDHLLSIPTLAIDPEALRAQLITAQRQGRRLPYLR